MIEKNFNPYVSNHKQIGIFFRFGTFFNSKLLFTWSIDYNHPVERSIEISLKDNVLWWHSFIDTW